MVMLLYSTPQQKNNLLLSATFSLIASMVLLTSTPLLADDSADSDLLFEDELLLEDDLLLDDELLNTDPSTNEAGSSPFGQSQAPSWRDYFVSSLSHTQTRTDEGDTSYMRQTARIEYEQAIAAGWFARVDIKGTR